jgi:hypothetical protein
VTVLADKATVRRSLAIEGRRFRFVLVHGRLLLIARVLRLRQARA